MSQTERDVTSRETDDSLEELFDDDGFDAALDDALEHADLELELVATDAVDDDLELELVATDAVDDDLESGGLIDVDDALEHADLELELVATDAVDDDLESGGLIDVDDDLTDDDYELPDIIAATPDGVDPCFDDDIDARDLVAPVGDPDLDDDLDDDDDVSDQILEELRRADIDGPVVARAPQDETTTARRRPRQAADYDPAPVPIPAKVPRILGRKARVRKVTRVVRHVDPWSVFKVALIAHLVLYIIVLTASVLLWNVANATGTVDNVERFFESFGWSSFEFNGGELYSAGWIAGLFVVIGLTGLAVLAATLFNLITDLVGGVRFTVLEEEVIETRMSPMRRFVVRRPEPEVPAVLRDSSGSMVREAVVDDTGANARPTR
ncbi:MAG: hypothetical protein ACJAR2_002095 [Ilumatobacter sp.]